MIHGNSKFPWILRCGICMDIVGSTIKENPNMVILWFSEVDLQMFFKNHTKSTMGFWNFQLHRGNRKNQVKNVNLFVWSLAMAIQNTTVTMEMGITKLFQLGFLNSINGIVLNSFNGKTKSPQLSWKWQFPNYFNLDFSIPSMEIVPSSNNGKPV